MRNKSVAMAPTVGGREWVVLLVSTFSRGASFVLDGVAGRELPFLMPAWLRVAVAALRPAVEVVVDHGQWAVDSRASFQRQPVPSA